FRAGAEPAIGYAKAVLHLLDLEPAQLGRVSAPRGVARKIVDGPNGFDAAKADCAQIALLKDCRERARLQQAPLRDRLRRSEQGNRIDRLSHGGLRLWHFPEH